MLSVGMLVKKAMKGHVDLLNPAMKVADELMGIPTFDTPDYSVLFAEEKEMITKLKKVFLMVARFVPLGISLVNRFSKEDFSYSKTSKPAPKTLASLIILYMV